MPNIVRKIRKIEILDGSKRVDDGASLFRVWYKDIEDGAYHKDYYEYIWGTDEFDVFQKVIKKTRYEHETTEV